MMNQLDEFRKFKRLVESAEVPVAKQVISEGRTTVEEAKDCCGRCKGKGKVICKECKGSGKCSMTEGKLNEKWGVKMHTPDSAKGMFSGQSAAEIRSGLERDKAKKNKTAAVKKDEHRREFALRAKNHFGKMESVGESMKLDEKWGEEDVVNPSKKGMFKGRSKESLIKERDRLRKKEKRTAAESTKLRELNFAIRSKGGKWGKAE